MRFYIVDAFAEEIFCGNPAGVVILDRGADFPVEDTMKKTAAELRYSETVFIKQINHNTYNMRYFTPVSEVDLCGHATVGAFGALLEEGAVEEGREYNLLTLAGNLLVRVENQAIMMDMSEPEELKIINDLNEKKEIAKALGVDSDSINLDPWLISTGLPDLIVEIKSRDMLLKMNPDFDFMTKLSAKYNVVGFHAYSMGNNGEISAYCRNFAPLYGINEEAATGTASGALIHYMFKHGKIKEGYLATFLQGESMRRPSFINSILKVMPEERINIKVGGKTAILSKGEIYI